ncbi:MAG: SAM-dependent methyltransferase [Paracoccaceae bacterium]|jgi:SAM-dependent methyltransferase
MSNRKCPICDHADSTPLPAYCRDQWSVEQCNNCSHVYLKNPPGYDALIEDFAWEKTFETEHQRRLAESPIAYRLDVATRVRHTAFRKSNADKYTAWFGSGNLLDIGCADAEEDYPGFVRYGIELSNELAKKADASMQAQGGYCIHGPGAEAIWKFPENNFDGIVMFSYLEHEEEPLKVLEGAVRALKPTGNIYVRVPNFGSLNRKVTGKKWVGFRYPDHVNYFTVSDLETLAAKAGLKVKLLNPIRLPFDDNINALLSRAT